MSEHQNKKKDIKIDLNEDVATEVTNISVKTFNMPEREGTESMLGEPFMISILSSLNKPATEPHLIFEHINQLSKERNLNECLIWYGANTYISALHDWHLDESTVKKANKHGMHIFLYEPMCLYTENDPYAQYNVFNSGFYSEFNADTISDFSKLRAAELDSISHFVHTNKLSKVTVHTGDYRCHLMSNYSDHMDLICDDLFLNTLSFYDHSNPTPKPVPEKHFFSANWRFTVNRCMISAILADKQSDLVYYFKQPKEVFDDGVWFSWEKYRALDSELCQQLEKGFDKLNETTPHYIDMPVENPVEINEAMMHFYPDPETISIGYGNPASFNQMYLPLENTYRRCFVDIVNESRYAQPTGNISEKVLQTIHMRTPFILVAPAYTLEYLRSMGFKTFGDWWDESYDTCEDPLERLSKIHKLINWISEKSMEELHQLNLEMREVIEYNHKLLGTLMISGKYADHTLIKQDIVHTEKQWMPEQNDFLNAAISNKLEDDSDE